MALAIIRHLEIKRFRGVRGLSWSPHPQLNVVVGAADGGKSTVLEAIALLSSPAPNYGLSEFDYHGRNLEVGFSIQAILSFSDISIMRDEGFPAPPMQGWLNDKLTDLPDEAGAEPVLVCRLTGTADQEPRYEVLGAGGEIRAPFSRAMRRRIGLARLGVTYIDSLTPTQIQTVFELYATHAIEARLCNDIGTKVVTLPVDPRAAARVEAQLRDFIQRGVSDAINAAGVNIQSLSPDAVTGFVTSVYQSAFEILQTMGDAEASE